MELRVPAERGKDFPFRDCRRPAGGQILPPPASAMTTALTALGYAARPRRRQRRAGRRPAQRAARRLEPQRRPAASTLRFGVVEFNASPGGAAVGVPLAGISPIGIYG